jgi:hypothetical protein
MDVSRLPLYFHTLGETGKTELVYSRPGMDVVVAV